MPTVQHVLDALEIIAPQRFGFAFDKIGLQVGDPAAKVQKAVVSLDRSLGAVEHARSLGAQLLLSHHPLLFEPLSAVDARSHVGRTVMELVRSNVNFIAAHTNWDSARGGINDVLAEMLGLTNVRDFGSVAEVRNLKLVFYSPAEAVDGIVDALTEVGAGTIGAYTRCSFRHTGTGTSLGGPGTRPAVGRSGRVEEVEELRVEMVLPENRQAAAIAALRKAHPYEEPAFDLLVEAPLQEQPAGRIGELLKSISLQDFSAQVDATLETRCWSWGDAANAIRTVAIVGGAADGEWSAARREGADLFLTGEVRQHVALEASESGMCILAAGHYATEHPGAAQLAVRMRAALPEIEWQVFTPEPGASGRPLA